MYKNMWRWSKYSSSSGTGQCVPDEIGKAKQQSMAKLPNVFKCFQWLSLVEHWLQKSSIGSTCKSDTIEKQVNYMAHIRCGSGDQKSQIWRPEVPVPLALRRMTHWPCWVVVLKKGWMSQPILVFARAHRCSWTFLDCFHISTLQHPVYLICTLNSNQAIHVEQIWSRLLAMELGRT